MKSFTPLSYSLYDPHGERRGGAAAEPAGPRAAGAAGAHAELPDEVVQDDHERRLPGSHFCRGSGAGLALRRLFETEGIHMDDGDQAVVRRRRSMWTTLGDGLPASVNATIGARRVRPLSSCRLLRVARGWYMNDSRCSATSTGAKCGSGTGKTSSRPL